MRVKSCWTNKRVALMRIVYLLSLICIAGTMYIMAGNKTDAHRSYQKMQHVEEIFSTCSRRADARGFHQNVIAYSVYGPALTQPELAGRYLKPLEETARHLPKLYPGWIMRIYHNISESDDASWKILSNLFSALPHVDLCNTTKVAESREIGRQMFPMTWRFLPLLDNLVDRFLSRDCDSPILLRELEAVQEWLKSNKTFHVIRDHPNHCVPMLGGLWGAKLYQKRAKIHRAADKMLRSRHEHRIGYDQDRLSLYIWPLTRRDMMTHDAYCCLRYPFATYPHPSQRSGNDFVGMVANYDNGNVTECPVECRPKPQGLDWKHC